MAKNRTAAPDLRRIWATTLAPLIVAARAGAAKAASTAREERARAWTRVPDQPARRRSRWALAVVGLAIAGSAGGVAAAVSGGRSIGWHGTSADPTQASETASSKARSIMEAGRDRAGDLARTVLDSIRNGGPDGVPAAAGETGAPGGSGGSAPAETAAAAETAGKTAAAGKTATSRSARSRGGHDPDRTAETSLGASQ